MALPNLTPEQRQAALAKAAQARRDRAELLAGVKSGQTSLAEVFDRADGLAKRTRVVQVLRAVPGYGPAKVAALMETVRIRRRSSTREGSTMRRARPGRCGG
jgi:hypothetical protein